MTRKTVVIVLMLSTLGLSCADRRIVSYGHTSGYVAYSSCNIEGMDHRSEKYLMITSVASGTQGFLLSRVSLKARDTVFFRGYSASMIIKHIYESVDITWQTGYGESSHARVTYSDVAGNCMAATYVYEK